MRSNSLLLWQLCPYGGAKIKYLTYKKVNSHEDAHKGLKVTTVQSPLTRILVYSSSVQDVWAALLEESLVSQQSQHKN